jgi:hypothetical protein
MSEPSSANEAGACFWDPRCNPLRRHEWYTTGENLGNDRMTQAEWLANRNETANQYVLVIPIRFHRSNQDGRAGRANLAEFAGHERKGPLSLMISTKRCR